MEKREGKTIFFVCFFYFKNTLYVHFTTYSFKKNSMKRRKTRVKSLAFSNICLKSLRFILKVSLGKFDFRNFSLSFRSWKKRPKNQIFTSKFQNKKLVIVLCLCKKKSAKNYRFYKLFCLLCLSVSN